jgi:hypothetical protein
MPECPKTSREKFSGFVGCNPAASTPPFHGNYKGKLPLKATWRPFAGAIRTQRRLRLVGSKYDWRETNAGPLADRDHSDCRSTSGAGASSGKQAEHQLARVSARRLHRRKLQIRERRERARGEAALPHDERLAAIMKNGDANDTLYEIESISDFSPEADLSKIKAHVMLINNVEDFADPPTRGTVERPFTKIAHGSYVLIPYDKDTHGHFTHYYAAIWKPYLVKFMADLPLAPPAVR